MASRQAPPDLISLKCVKFRLKLLWFRLRQTRKNSQKVRKFGHLVISCDLLDARGENLVARSRVAQVRPS